MISIKIYRGTHQIGGCCTEIRLNGKRLLIDFGANLPGADEKADIKDSELVERVFGNETADAVLFTHYHGDHYGLYKQIPEEVPLYIGPVAKQILQILTPYIDYGSEVKGMSRIDNMNTYEPGKDIGIFPDIKIVPFYIDHSALDAYMFYIEAQGKKILFTGDFREHGIMGKKDRMRHVMNKYKIQDIDVLITEGTMLSRKEANGGTIRTEEELGKKAAQLFSQEKFNFVMVSSTNLDSIMEFYRATPQEKCFVCDLYQAKVILCAMKGKGFFPEYMTSVSHPTNYVLGCEKNKEKEWDEIRRTGKELRRSLQISAITSKEMYQKGFVMLVRKNSHPDNGENVFEKMLNSFYPIKSSYRPDAQIIYSMWDGYLSGAHKDEAITSFIGGRQNVERLHTSGHAYADTIKRLIEKVNPKMIIPMHTECADDFAKIKEFAAYKERIRVLGDGEELKI